MKNEMPNQDSQPEGTILFNRVDDLPAPIIDMLMHAVNSGAMTCAMATMKNAKTLRSALGTYPIVHDQLVTLMKETCRLTLCSYNNVGTLFVMIGFAAYVQTVLQHFSRCAGLPLTSMQVEVDKNTPVEADVITGMVGDAMQKERAADALHAALKPKKPAAN